MNRLDVRMSVKVLRMTNKGLDITKTWLNAEMVEEPWEKSETAFWLGCILGVHHVTITEPVRWTLGSQGKDQNNNDC